MIGAIGLVVIEAIDLAEIVDTDQEVIADIDPAAIAGTGRAITGMDTLITTARAIIGIITTVHGIIARNITPITIVRDIIAHGTMPRATTHRAMRIARAIV